jgi:hypothetical protein
MVFLPPTTDFPPNPETLSREDLNSVYLELRNCYKTSIRSRGQHRSLANKARGEATQLRERLITLANREASVRKDVYEMLEIVTALAGDIEDVGDDLVKEFGRYKLGRKTYQGGSYLGGLVQAVIGFINRWTRAKERVVELDQKRQQFLEKSKDLQSLQLASHGDELAPAVQGAKVDVVVSPSAEASEHGSDR